MGIGPVPAVHELLERTQRLPSYELIELNEAFAAQVLACDRELRLDRGRLNVNGGAIALGHPIGARGRASSRRCSTRWNDGGARLGLATLCVSGGLGLALELVPGTEST